MSTIVTSACGIHVPHRPANSRMRTPLVAKLVGCGVAGFLVYRYMVPCAGPELIIVAEFNFRDGHADEGTRLLAASAQGSRKEAGCVRFDVMRDQAVPTRLVTFEAFTTAADLEVHRAQSHTRAWGAFQFGELKPVGSKRVMRLSPVDFTRPRLLSRL